nr:hypothetical protein [Clostridia bacterium]
MAANDTMKLLQECSAGIKMGVSSIDDAIDNVKNPNLRTLLENSKKEHEKLDSETEAQLGKFGQPGKGPNAMARGMSWMKTTFMLAADPGDDTVAKLMTDGCDMGIKELSKYMNDFSDADAQAKGLTSRLIQIEDQLAQDLRQYL